MAGTQELIDEILTLHVLDAIQTYPENDERSDGMDVVNDPEEVVQKSLIRRGRCIPPRCR